MKSRKKVSRKKTAHRTRMRRSRSRGDRTRNKSNRGGMMRSARAVVGTLVYHDILPLVEASRFINNVGYDPKPDDGSITKAYKRFYRTFADIPVDDGIKESIRNLREELNDPVKNADKIKSIYDAIMKKLEEEKKKPLANPSQGLMVVGKSFRPPSYQERLSLVDVGRGASASGGDSPRFDQFVNPPFRSPNPQRYPDYSTKPKTPLKPLSKKDTFRVDDDIDETGTPIQTPIKSISFLSPLHSPPPSSANDEQRPDDAKTLVFDES